jgi:hypothetical protein
MIRFVKTLAGARLLLVALFICAPAMAQNASPYSGEKEAVVAQIGDLLTVNHVFPDRAALAKAKIASALAAGEYDGITDAATFAQRLTADLQTVTHDKHMRVLSGLNERPAAGMPAPPPTNAGFARVDRLKGNIGYIKLLGFPGAGPFNLATDQAMADLASTDALIIDMRDNGGGRDE